MDHWELRPPVSGGPCALLSVSSIGPRVGCCSSSPHGSPACCRLTVFLKFTSKPNAQCGDIRKWGLWEVIVSEGWSPHERH